MICVDVILPSESNAVCRSSAKKIFIAPASFASKLHPVDSSPHWAWACGDLPFWPLPEAAEMDVVLWKKQRTVDRLTQQEIILSQHLGSAAITPNSTLSARTRSRVDLIYYVIRIDCWDIIRYCCFLNVRKRKSQISISLATGFGLLLPSPQTSNFRSPSSGNSNWRKLLFKIPVHEGQLSLGAATCGRTMAWFSTHCTWKMKTIHRHITRSLWKLDFLVCTLTSPNATLFVASHAGTRNTGLRDL